MRFLAILVTALPLALSSPVPDTSGNNTNITTHEAAVQARGVIMQFRPDSQLDTVLELLQPILTLRSSSIKWTYGIGDFKAAAISGPLTANVLQSLLKANPLLSWVTRIEEDVTVSTAATLNQTNAPYGLARLSSRPKGRTTYYYDESSGSGTYAYVIDTGIYTQHVEFEGRAVPGESFPVNGNSNDGNGHGTHVAGTIGSRRYGVAKKAKLIAVKVLSDSGSGALSDVIKGIEWSVKNATSSGRVGRSVANLSLGSSRSAILNDAISAAVNAGMFVAVAAGNEGQNAINTSPASAPEACTVGAIDSNDTPASFSNYGDVLDIWAPGVDVLSTWIGNPTATARLSGTSMASPHAAGLAAYFYGLWDRQYSITGQVMCTKIKSLATRDAIARDKLRGSSNLIGYNGIGV